MDRQTRQAIAVRARRGLRVAPGAPGAAQTPVAIKLATLVPEDSVWDKNLKQMGDEWKQATGGRVTVTVFSGGSQGDEPTVLRKMRLDALQAALVHAPSASAASTRRSTSSTCRSSSTPTTS